MICLFQSKLLDDIAFSVDFTFSMMFLHSTKRKTCIKTTVKSWINCSVNKTLLVVSKLGIDAFLRYYLDWNAFSTHKLIKFLCSTMILELKCLCNHFDVTMKGFRLDSRNQSCSSNFFHFNIAPHACHERTIAFLLIKIQFYHALS
jgi:hypothetical protein